MRSDFLFAFFVLLLFFAPCDFAAAQKAAGGKSAISSKSYKKISADSVRARPSSSAAKSGKADALKSKAVKKQVAPKTKKVKADSVAYTPKRYLLGERVIMPGDSGRDVRSVAKILVNKLYIDEESLVYTADGGVLYDAKLLKAVKHFQEFNGFHPDGIIGAALVKALRKRKANR